MADDMGYSDLGCYGSEIATPHLDQLAQNGIRFRSFYNAARCCPTRASLLTGLYPHEAGMGGMVSDVDANPEPGPYQGFLNNNCVTIAEVLKEAGYNTYMSGKWHVGEKPEYWPRNRGFDRYFGLISGGSSYYEIIKDQPRVRQMALDDAPWMPPAEGFYMTDAISDFAVDFLDEHFASEEKQPFFLYLAYTAPHWPLHALPEDIQKYEGKYDAGWEALRKQRYENMLKKGVIDSTYALSPQSVDIPNWEEVENQSAWARRMTVYAAMVDRMDQGIGKVKEALKSYQAMENTLIIFLSDNGGSDENITGRKLNNPEIPIGERGSYVAYREPWANVSNTPFRKYKKWTHEGGISTPFIMHWPKGTDRKGELETNYAHIVDIMATCKDVAGAQYPATFQDNTIKPMRGQSLRWALQGENRTENPPLYWEHFGHRAVHQGNWKLVSAPPEHQWELYNLSEDPAELHDLSQQNTDQVEELSALYHQWADEVGVKQ
jgi:arylsulfatase